MVTFSSPGFLIAFFTSSWHVGHYILDFLYECYCLVPYNFPRLTCWIQGNEISRHSLSTDGWSGTVVGWSSEFGGLTVNLGFQLSDLVDTPLQLSDSPMGHDL